MPESGAEAVYGCCEVYISIPTHFPEIDWITGDIQFSRCPRRCQARGARTPVPRKAARRVPCDTRDDAAERILCIMVDNQAENPAIASISQGLAEQAERQKTAKSFEEIVPAEYHSFRQVFDKSSFDELPPCCTWDHTIELKDGASPKVGKIYPLSPDEQKQLEGFVDENRRSDRIDTP